MCFVSWGPACGLVFKVIKRRVSTTLRSIFLAFFVLFSGGQKTASQIKIANKERVALLLIVFKVIKRVQSLAAKHS